MLSVDLRDVFLEGLVSLDHEPFVNKNDAFDYVAKLLKREGIITREDAYIKSLKEREDLGSTYMGNYIAIPHGKCNEVNKSAIVFVRCKAPFIYQSNDEEGEVKYLFAFAIAGSQKGEDYLRVLALLASYLANEKVIDMIDKAQSYQELIEGFALMDKEEEVLE